MSAEPENAPPKKQPWPFPFNILQEEWPEVKNAKFSFILCAVVFVIAGGTVIFFLFNSFILPGKDATIVQLQGQVVSLKENQKLPNSKEQSPVYQQQIVLKNEVKNFAKHILEIAPDAQNEFFISDDFTWLRRLCEDLKKQGLNDDKLKGIYRANGFNSKTLKEMSDELNRLAEQLPINDKTIENKGENK